jgi:serine O-acetyltransferase
MEQTIKRLLEKNPNIFEFNSKEKNLPSLEKISKLVKLSKSILFPGYFDSEINHETDFLIDNLKNLYELLFNQFSICIKFKSNYKTSHTDDIDTLVTNFIQSLPKVRELLYSDVNAIYKMDPAAKNIEEIIYCYPTIKAMIHYRIAHEIDQLGIPILPRIISEFAHSETGIDIHPSAKIGNFFCIDHGTGVVIGETCIIGNNVTIYQGVTLGAKKFYTDKNGNVIKGEPRHPILEDDVTIYSNATILGRISIGRGSVIGGNVWLTESIPPNTKLTQSKFIEEKFTGGLGI